ncbi:MAG: AMP-binding protein [Bacilli bacterium]|nr:AMP-binding protein [Bacilli bacterium]
MYEGKPNSFIEYLEYGYNNFADKKCFFEKKNDKYIGYTFNDIYNDTKSIANLLIKNKLSNKKIIIIGKNSYNWLMTYLSIVTYVGVVVPIDNSWPLKEIKNVINDIDEADCIICDQEKYQLLIKDIDKKIKIFKLEDILIKSQNLKKEKYKKKKDTDLVEILYTSGTSEKPKAIMLSTKNIFANMDGVAKFAPVTTNDKYLVILPFHHIYTLVILVIYPLYIGISIYLSTPKDLVNDLKIVKPTIFPGVPLIFTRVINEIPEEKKVKIKKGIKISNFLRKFGIDIRKRLFKEFYDFWGGNIFFFTCGAASLDYDIAKLYDDMGIIILQGYGLSEASPIVTMNDYHNYRIDSCGQVLMHQKIKIIDMDASGIGEIAIKGDNVMLGYYKNKDLTKKSYTKDGYFKTGDLGYIDDEERLHVIGRKKKIIVTSNGKNIDATEIENIIKKESIISDAKVYCEKDKIVADIYTNSSNNKIDKIINNLNKDLPKYKRISKYNIKIVDNNNVRIK